MKRIAVATAVAGVGVVTVRAVVPRLHARLLAACEHMFAEMPEGFPPKRMLRGIEETRTNTARILELLERRDQAQERAALGATQPTRTDEMEVVVA